MKEVCAGVFREGRSIATKNLDPGHSVYGERRVASGGAEYRLWDPYRSKLAAAVARGLRDVPIRPGQTVLYLGAAQGTTASHVSDIVGSNGLVVCIDFAPKAFEKLLEVCERRHNMVPLLADAAKPEQYSEYLETADVIYQDIAQKEQAGILVKNAKRYLRPGGWAILMIKARSIDVAAKPSDIFKREIEKLEKAGFGIAEVLHLAPYEEDHAAVVARFTRP
jgi:fibrillarin-like pre-rRNA processing protein